jgi:hypothetical protein
VISGNELDGVLLQDAATGNLVEGNYIGTDKTGTLQLGNGDGVQVLAPQNTIGATVSGGRNVISGNAMNGVDLAGAEGGLGMNLVEGNYIGVDASGTTALPNSDSGVLIENGAPNNTIGATVSGGRNVISGNGASGIFLDGAGGAKIEGNRIGTDKTGTAPLPNGGSGVLAYGGCCDTIGGTTAAAANTIAFNDGTGVTISSSESYDDGVIRNSIFQNAGLGIALLAGANDFQKTPTITSVTTNGTKTTIKGTFGGSDPAPLDDYRIEAFTSPNCDPSGTGEGQTFLKAVTAHLAGAFTITLAALPAGQTLTTTVTGLNPGTYETSQFSNCVTTP